MVNKRILEECLCDPAFLAETEISDSEMALQEIMLDVRHSAKLTQGDIAKRMGISRTTVARLEFPKYEDSLTLKKFGKYIEACGAHLEMKVVTLKKKKNKSVINA